MISAPVKNLGNRVIAMQVLGKINAIGLLLILLTSCSSGMAGPSFRSEPEIFRVGELEVRLYQDREKMMRDLPGSLAWAEALRIGGKQLKVLGYYDQENKRIFSVDDARVLLHELKHYLEPGWRHEIGSHSLAPSQPAIRSACVDCPVFLQERNAALAPVPVVSDR
jgi:hypothetical protein